MASPLRLPAICRILQRRAPMTPSSGTQSPLHRFALPAAAATRIRRIHTSQPSDRSRTVAGPNNEPVPDQPPPTDLETLDVLGGTPVPSTAVNTCYPDGFALNSGVRILDGDGALLVGGEAFAWRPWGADKRLVNGKGQFEVGEEGFGLLGLVWPRPDLLILGLGPEMRPLSPETRRVISSLGMRVEVLDTRNAAAQFNLLATERGVHDVAAALIPTGWKEGVGAV